MNPTHLNDLPGTPTIARLGGLTVPQNAGTQPDAAVKGNMVAQNPPGRVAVLDRLYMRGNRGNTSIALAFRDTNAADNDKLDLFIATASAVGALHDPVSIPQFGYVVDEVRSLGAFVASAIDADSVRPLVNLRFLDRLQAMRKGMRYGNWGSCALTGIGMLGSVLATSPTQFIPAPAELNPGDPAGALTGNGTATSGSTTTIVHSGKTWTVNVYQGKFFTAEEGTGAGQSGMIVSNTGTTLTFAAVGVAFDNTTKFRIHNQLGLCYRIKTIVPLLLSTANGSYTYTLRSLPTLTTSNIFTWRLSVAVNGMRNTVPLTDVDIPVPANRGLHVAWSSANLTGSTLIVGAQILPVEKMNFVNLTGAFPQ